MTTVTVTVDLKDLETVVFATGALKTIEGALQARKNDPFVMPHLNFTPAHNRLAQAMREATRASAGTAVGWDDPLTLKEAILLGDIVKSADTKDDDLLFGVVIPADEKVDFDSLSSKGMIKFGQHLVGVLWSGEEVPRLQVDPDNFSVVIMARGRQAWVKHQADKAKAASLT